MDSRNIINLIEGYKEISTRLEYQKILFYKTKFNGLLTGYNSLKSLLDKIERSEANSYNIFSILNVENDEVKTHTPFLTNLLDPFETHSQKELFLKSFLDEFIPAEKRKNFYLDKTDDYSVTKEKRTSKGTIDIYITSINSKRRFGIVIENKIYASDQELQLYRYYEFLKRRNFENEQFIIFYLTIDGSDPSEYSINKDTLYELKSKNALKNISYKKDIYKWLSGLLHQIKSEKVRYSIAQYLNTIENL